MKQRKKEVYAAYGIDYQNGKIYAPMFGWIAPLLANGNTKLGKGVYTFSILPTNKTFAFEIGGTERDICGTCPCNCPGCYATKGNYNFSSVKISLAKKTILCYEHLDFVRRAIIAQIIADKIAIVRIHAAGDFFSLDYIAMWQDIIARFPAVLFWSYTKYQPAESAFNDFENMNMVPSIVPGCGFNFGHIDYIMRLFEMLHAKNESVYICRCGIDNNQHCANCKGCATNKYVLFVEHSTDYNAEADPLFPVIRDIIESQKSMETEAV